MAQDSSRPDFWDTRYGKNVMPWDAGGVPPALARFAAAAPPRRALLPGCGSGYEVRFLAQAGWDVTAIDFSTAAIAAASRVLGDWARLVQCADFFEFEFGAPFDLVYERAFLCALPRTIWPRYAQRTAELLKPGGLLAGFFYYADEARGPPFGTSEAELNSLLGGRFTRIQDQPVADSIPVFQGKERWQVWRLIS